jgi:CheY-like chemotaxis protein
LIKKKREILFRQKADKSRGPKLHDLTIMSDPRPLHVFIVENHADTLRFLSLYLEGLGHMVTSANTMAQALERLPEANCDMLISDIGLPDGDGWELLRQARLPRAVYAVAMSGFGMNADRLKSKAAGYRRHLLKPFVPGELDAALKEAAQEAVSHA